MKRIMKGVIAAFLGVSLFCSVNAKAESTDQKTKMVDNTTSEEVVMAEISISKEEVMANVTRIATNGEVDGNGVRLRAKASSTAKVLELMYNGEAVAVNIGKMEEKGNTIWYYLKRIKTGTWGYANSNYIIYY